MIDVINWYILILEIKTAERTFENSGLIMNYSWDYYMDYQREILPHRAKQATDFVLGYCNRGERLNSTPLKQKVRGFLKDGAS